MRLVGRWLHGSGIWRVLWHGVCIELLPVFPTIRSVPRHVAFITDGSWFPSDGCGGAFVVVCLETLTWVVYHVPIPCQLDHSFAIEVLWGF